MHPSPAASSIPACSSTARSPRAAASSRPVRAATSPIEIEPAPPMALSKAQRSAVSTSHNSSGVAKLIRSVLAAAPDAMVLAASDRLSANERTSRTTVVMVPPLQIGKKIAHQLFGRLKLIQLLIGRCASMIALAALVVVAQHAAATNDIGHPVVELVCRVFEWSR